MKRRVQRHDVIQPLDPSYKLIPLTQGQNALVDTADFEWLSQWNWYADWDRDARTFYAKRKEWGTEKHLTMHGFILGCIAGEQGDHKNRDGLDNRRENLRKCTHAQNVRNAKTHWKTISGFRGVCRSKKRWRTRIHVDGVRKTVGFFATREDAARAYDEAAKIYHGEFASLNFPPIP